MQRVEHVRSNGSSCPLAVKPGGWHLCGFCRVVLFQGVHVVCRCMHGNLYRQDNCFALGEYTRCRDCAGQHLVFYSVREEAHALMLGARCGVAGVKPIVDERVLCERILYGGGFVLRLRESGVPLRARPSCAEWLELHVILTDACMRQQADCWQSSKLITCVSTMWRMKDGRGGCGTGEVGEERGRVGRVLKGCREESGKRHGWDLWIMAFHTGGAQCEAWEGRERR
ncbi:hypothetical protein EAH_00066300 [Eimeria acervulina]|uniref:Uncharacterized protein n=1 Tax=Eimeria acervulina TaxID=5801 RepID=U6GQC2_EIMAC|nr:hypothetical protein EAH_00066300 [Eimeria acervulina]CDI82395.1 hypothetical protein EAH_00066300 [Eimeria acervulina]